MKPVLIGLGLGLAVALSAGAADAHSWYVLEASSNRCLTGAVAAARYHLPPMLSPYRLERYARRTGMFVGLDAPTGSEAAKPNQFVGIKIQPPGETTLEILFFRDRDICEAVTAMQPGPADLK
jgi:hypothetical protein